MASLFGFITGTTCGEACWSAREESCRCSCGGANHGCDRDGTERPERTAKINGYRYRLALIDNDYVAVARAAYEINTANHPTIRGRWNGRTTVGEAAMQKTASEAQMKWDVLAPYRDQRRRPQILWVREDAITEVAS